MTKLKHLVSNLDKGLVVQEEDAAINLLPVGVLCILGSQYIDGILCITGFTLIVSDFM